MNKVKIGMIGSQFAARLHLNNLSKLRGIKAEVIAVASKRIGHAESFAQQYGIPDFYDDYRRILDRKDVDLVDLCVPTDLHEDFCVEAAEAGKHIICEKPLTGFFGKDRPEEQVGFSVSKAEMLEETRKSCHRVMKAVAKNKVKFLYAENWIYAPPLTKLKNLLKASGGTVMDIRAEQSHSGSIAPYSRKWKTSGGGSLMRLGAHPVGGVLHLKHYEGLIKFGQPIRAKSVMAEIGQHTKMDSFVKEKKPHQAFSWVPPICCGY